MIAYGPARREGLDELSSPKLRDGVRRGSLHRLLDASSTLNAEIENYNHDAVD
jgi:hypothetical protein